MHEALENAVSKYPEDEGRFAQVSGIKFPFDPKQPAGKRIKSDLIQVQDEYLDPEYVGSCFLLVKVIIL